MHVCARVHLHANARAGLIPALEHTLERAKALPKALPEKEWQRRDQLWQCCEGTEGLRELTTRAEKVGVPLNDLEDARKMDLANLAHEQASRGSQGTSMIRSTIIDMIINKENTIPSLF